MADDSTVSTDPLSPICIAGKSEVETILGDHWDYGTLRDVFLMWDLRKFTDLDRDGNGNDEEWFWIFP